MPLVSNIVSPEDRVKSRKNVFDDFINVAQPAAASQQKYEKAQGKRDVMGATVSGAGKSQGDTQSNALSTLTKGAQVGTQLLGQQATTQQNLNMQGGEMQQQIAAAKNAQSVGNVKRGLDKDIDTYTKVVADRAFQEGIAAKQLIFHMNSNLADYAMGKLKEDFEAGRTSKAEIQQIFIAQKERLQERKLAADRAMVDFMGNYQKDLASGNVRRAKQLLDSAVQAQKDLAKDAVRAKNTASILEGIVETIVETITGIFS